MAAASAGWTGIVCRAIYLEVDISALTPLAMISAIRTLVLPALSTGLGDRRRRWFEPRTLPVYAIIALSAVPVIVAVAGGWFDYDAALIFNTLEAIGAFLLVAYAARWIGFEMLAAPLEMLMLSLIITLMMSFAAAAIAATGAPLVDDALRRADTWFLGFHKEAVVAHVAQIPWFRTATIWIYDSLAYTPQLLVIILLAKRDYARAWTALTAVYLAMAISVVCLLFFPAYGQPPFAYDYITTLNGLRAGTLRTFDSSVINGLVTFPSLHAADAVILAWGFSWLGRWAAPAVVVNILMVGTALFVGGHYLVDLIAGCGLAVAAMLSAQWIQARIGTRWPRFPARA